MTNIKTFNTQYEPGVGLDKDRFRFKKLLSDYSYSHVIETVNRFNNAYRSQHHQDYVPKLVIAGGFLRAAFDDSEQVNDIDIFVIDPIEGKSELERDDRLHDLRLAFDDAVRFSRTNWCTVFRCPEDKLTTYETPTDIRVQVIHEKSYQSVDELLASFDIRACCFALTAAEEITYIEGAIEDVKVKDIVINNVEYPIATMNRIAKYKNKGYKIRDIELQRFMLATYNSMKRFDMQRPLDISNPVPDSWALMSDVDAWEPYFETTGRRYID